MNIQAPDDKSATHESISLGLGILRGAAFFALVTVASVIGLMIVIPLFTGPVFKVYQGPQLSDELREKTLIIVKADPQVQQLLAEGARIGIIRPISVAGQKANGEEFSETWAEVELEQGGKTWKARVNLPQSRVDQLGQ